MKKILIFTVAVLAVFSFTSCEDMLEEEAYGRPTIDEMLTNEANVAKVVGQAYAELKWLHDHWGYWGLNTISTDEACCPLRNPGNDWSDDGYWNNFNTQDWGPNDLGFEYVWQYSSAGAILCNKILQQLEDAKENIPADVYARFTAELKVLRCYYYYALFDCFGRVPYLENYSDDASGVPQMESWEIWNKLVTTLEAEADNLPLANVPSKAENYGRATRGMAYTLLARLYLNAESFGVTVANCGISDIKSNADFYTRCVGACDSVINSKVYTIEPDFFTNFKIYNENSNENIFVIVENGNASFDYRDVGGKMANKLRITMLTLNYTHQQAWRLIEKPWNGFCARKSFLDKYEYQVDLRGPCDSTKGTDACDGWGWFLGPVKDAEGNTLNMDKVDYVETILDANGDTIRIPVLDKDGKEQYKDGKLVTRDSTITHYVPAIMNSTVTSMTNATHRDGARLLKYEVEKNGTNKYCENDFVLMRYADVLYMKAEGILRGGAGDLNALLADSEFQRIRMRAGVTPYASLDLDELLDERGREFAWEMVRRRDLIRYNQFSQGTWDFKGVKDKTLDWFPIPRKMIETSGGLWTQNPGYKTDK